MDLVQQNGLFLILSSFVLLFGPEVINQLVELLVLLEVVLELVNCLFGDLVKFVFLLLDWCRFLYLAWHFLLFGSCYILLFNLHLLFVYFVHFLSQQLSGYFLLLLLQKTKYPVVVLVHW